MNTCSPRSTTSGDAEADGIGPVARSRRALAWRSTLAPIFEMLDGERRSCSSSPAAPFCCSPISCRHSRHDDRIRRPRHDAGIARRADLHGQRRAATSASSSRMAATMPFIASDSCRVTSLNPALKRYARTVCRRTAAGFITSWPRPRIAAPLPAFPPSCQSIITSAPIPLPQRRRRFRLLRQMQDSRARRRSTRSRA